MSSVRRGDLSILTLYALSSSRGFLLMFGLEQVSDLSCFTCNYDFIILISFCFFSFFFQAPPRVPVAAAHPRPTTIERPLQCPRVESSGEGTSSGAQPVRERTSPIRASSSSAPQVVAGRLATSITSNTTKEDLSCIVLVICRQNSSLFWRLLFRGLRKISMMLSRQPFKLLVMARSSGCHHEGIFSINVSSFIFLMHNSHVLLILML